MVTITRSTDKYELRIGSENKPSKTKKMADPELVKKTKSFFAVNPKDLTLTVPAVTKDTPPTLTVSPSIFYNRGKELLNVACEAALANFKTFGTKCDLSLLFSQAEGADSHPTVNLLTEATINNVAKKFGRFSLCATTFASPSEYVHFLQEQYATFKVTLPLASLLLEFFCVIADRPNNVLYLACPAWAINPDDAFMPLVKVRINNTGTASSKYPFWKFAILSPKASIRLVVSHHLQARISGSVSPSVDPQRGPDEFVKIASEAITNIVNKKSWCLQVSSGVWFPVVGTCFAEPAWTDDYLGEFEWQKRQFISATNFRAAKAEQDELFETRKQNNARATAQAIAAVRDDHEGAPTPAPTARKRTPRAAPATSEAADQEEEVVAAPTARKRNSRAAPASSGATEEADEVGSTPPTRKRGARAPANSDAASAKKPRGRAAPKEPSDEEEKAPVRQVRNVSNKSSAIDVDADDLVPFYESNKSKAVASSSSDAGAVESEPDYTSVEQELNARMATLGMHAFNNKVEAELETAVEAITLLHDNFASTTGFRGVMADLYSGSVNDDPAAHQDGWALPALVGNAKIVTKLPTARGIRSHIPTDMIADGKAPLSISTYARLASLLADSKESLAPLFTAMRSSISKPTTEQFQSLLVPMLPDETSKLSPDIYNFFLAYCTQAFHDWDDFMVAATKPCTDKAHEAINGLQKVITELKTATENELRAVLQEKDRYKARVKTLTASNKSVNEKLATAKAAFSEMEAAWQSEANQRQKLEEAIAELQAQKDALQEDINSMTAENDQMAEKVQKYQKSASKASQAAKLDLVTKEKPASRAPAKPKAAPRTPAKKVAPPPAVEDLEDDIEQFSEDDNRPTQSYADFSDTEVNEDVLQRLATLDDPAPTGGDFDQF